jgi:hypothetical protein
MEKGWKDRSFISRSDRGARCDRREKQKKCFLYGKHFCYILKVYLIIVIDGRLVILSLWLIRVLI